MNPTEFQGEKAWLIVVSIACGILVFLNISLERIPATERVNVGTFFSPNYQDKPTTTLSLSGRSNRLIALAALAGIGTALLYPLFAALAMSIFQDIRNWAYRGEVHPLPLDELLMLGCLWPVALLAGAIVYIFIGIINRAF